MTTPSRAIWKRVKRMGIVRKDVSAIPRASRRGAGLRAFSRWRRVWGLSGSPPWCAQGGTHPAFKWVNTALGNIKAAITGTYRAINSKHVPRYLAEFEYRFNRRYDLAAIISRLTWAAVRAAPMPYRLLKLAEVCA